MKKELICVICPKGCALSAEVENGEVISVTGNGCPRGTAYAKSEVINPVRTLTTTMRTDSGGLLPVKTAGPVPKSKLFELMRIINVQTAKTPVEIGDVLIYNIGGSGIDLIAAKSMK